MSVTSENLKTFLHDCYPDLAPQLAHSSSNAIDGWATLESIVAAI